jgi:hypothetical protein
MRLIPCFALAAALLLPSAVYAQQITIAGWVDRVDPASATLTIRTLANPRTIPVAPNAAIRINGTVARLEQLPFNSPVSIIAEKDANGVLHATQISVRTSGGQPSAAAPPGAVVRGRLVGINLPAGTITLRTPSGDYPVPLGTAPIYVNGTVGSSRDLRLGETVQVDRSQPTPASTDFVTQAVRIVTPGGQSTGRTAGPGGSRAGSAGPNGGAGARTQRAVTGSARGTAVTAPLDTATGAGVVDRGRPITRTRGYIGTYRARRSRSLTHSRRTVYRSRRHRTRRRARRTYTRPPA